MRKHVAACVTRHSVPLQRELPPTPANTPPTPPPTTDINLRLTAQQARWKKAKKCHVGWTQLVNGLAAAVTKYDRRESSKSKTATNTHPPPPPTPPSAERSTTLGAMTKKRKTNSPNEYHVCPTFTREWYSAHSSAIAGRLAAPLSATRIEIAAPAAAAHQRFSAVGGKNQKTVGSCVEMSERKSCSQIFSGGKRGAERGGGRGGGGC